MQAQRVVGRVVNGNISIRLTESFNQHRVEVSILTLDEDEKPSSQRRPHPDILGQVRIKGDIFTSTSEQDWGLCL
ncbi:MAG: hypothetical protein H7842_11080 [Gammaproteobacteria bacterium SHHR-1]|uniref:hypothetical protein n=1 Tax=Magnetovirga frankeli TaxID=947516 RepID=UPI001294113E|nr:hypothetical protein D5125_17150 [gamma proteobacterium SS-5]